MWGTGGCKDYQTWSYKADTQTLENMTDDVNTVNDFSLVPVDRHKNDERFSFLTTS